MVASMDYTFLVKRKIWHNNVRASSRGQKPGFVLMDNKYLVKVTTNQTEKPVGCDFLALVTDYGDHQKIRFFDKKGKEAKAFLYHKGRLGK